MRTFGALAYDAARDEFEVRCEPHVAIRLKQVFRRASNRTPGAISLKATDEVARDLEWFLHRYPMLLGCRTVLEERARRFDARAADVVRILDGTLQLPLLELAKPAREYQRQAAALALRTGGLLLADEVGLGKTVSALAMLANPGTLPAVVVCPAHLPGQWEREIRRFLPGSRPHVAQRAASYSLKNLKGGQPDILILSYAKLAGWAHHLAGWARTVVFDEVQELRHGLAPKRPQKYEGALVLAGPAAYRLGLSATPIYNYGGEFFAVVEVLRPGALGDRHEFSREWCIDAGGGKLAIADPPAFGTYLREAGIMLRRTRGDVARELPAVSHIVQEVDVDQAQFEGLTAGAAELARALLTADTNFERMKAAGEFDARMRLATGLAKAPFVAEFVRLLLDSGEPVVLFGWHHAVYDVWRDRLRAFEPAFFTGGESPAQKQAQADRFVRGDTPLLVMSLRSGAGLDGLQGRCRRVVFGELDWSPGAMEQCVGRVHRDGQPDACMAYYLTATSGCDPVMVDVLGLKAMQLTGTLRPDAAAVELRQVDPDHVKRLARQYLVRHGRHEAQASLGPG